MHQQRIRHRRFCQANFATSLAVVWVPRDTKDIYAAVEELLAPYDEDVEVEEYDRGMFHQELGRIDRAGERRTFFVTVTRSRAAQLTYPAAGVFPTDTTQ